MQADERVAEAQDALLQILNNDEALESHHQSEYESFYRVIDTMPETFVVIEAPSDQRTATLHFNAYFLAKILTKATSARSFAIVAKIALHLIYRLLGERDKVAAAALLTMVRNNFATDSILALPPGEPPCVKIPDPNQLTYVRGVLLQLMGEFLQMVPELEAKSFYAQVIAALPEVFGDRAGLQAWLHCAKSLYGLLLEIEFVSLREHFVDTLVAILSHLCEVHRIGDFQSELRQLLGQTSKYETLSVNNVKALVNVWSSLKPLWASLTPWLARSAPADQNVRLLILGQIPDLFRLPHANQLIDQLDISPQYLAGIQLEPVHVRVYGTLCRKPALAATVRAQVETYFHGLFPITDIQIYPLAVACCRILLTVSGGQVEQAVTNVVFIPLLSVSPSAAAFVRDRHRVTVSMDDVSGQADLVGQCIGLVPLFSETRVNTAVRRSIIMDASKKRSLFAAVVANVHLYRDECDSVLKAFAGYDLTPDELSQLAGVLLKLPCVLAGETAKRDETGERCACEDGQSTLITSAVGETLAECVVNVLSRADLPAETRNLLAVRSSLHLRLSQSQFDRLLDVFLMETAYLVRLGLVRALYQGLQNNPALEPTVDLGPQFADVENRDVYETSLMLVGRILAARPALKPVYFKHLAGAVCASVMYLQTVALSEIHWLSRHSGVSLRQMMIDHRQLIAQCVFRAAVDAPSRSLEDILRCVWEAFDANSDNLVPCLSLLHRFLLPMFAAHGGEDAQQRVREIAKLSSIGNSVAGNTQSKVLALTAKYLPQIVTYLFTTHRRDPAGKCEAFLSFAIGKDWRTLFTEGMPHRIVYEFLTYLPIDEAGVKQGISHAARLRERHISDESDIRAFVCEHQNLLGVLFYYDTNIRKALAEEKLRIISSLPEFIRFLGVQPVTSVRIKLMYILRTASSMTENNIHMLKCCADAWFMFVKSLDKSGLPTIIGDLVMSVLPLLNTPEVLAQAREILEYLLIENKHCYSERLHELAFLQEMDKLPMSIRKTFAMKNVSFKESLGHSVVNICNESNSVRRLVLKRLARLLSEHHEALSELLDSDAETDFVSEMIRQLFACCQTADPVIHSLVGECLAHLGALDPARVQLRLTASEQEQVPVLIAEDSKFAHGLLKRLVNTFLTYSHHSDMQNRASYAIQELSKTYRLPEDKELWRLFKTHEQEVIKMLSGTKYVLTNKVQDNTSAERPIFNGPLGTDFRAWINAWIKSLLPLVRDPTERHVMDLSSLIAVNDVSVAQFILPSLVSTVMVTASDDEVEQIKQEVVSVLDGGANVGAGTALRSKEMQHMATQTVFSLLGHLLGVARIASQMRHRSATRAEKSNSNRSANNQHNDDRRFKFAEGIAQDKLARAAFGCQEYSRALMHLSRYLRAHPDELQNNLTFLQDIYVGLNDPDGVAGAAAKRKKDASLKEKIIEHKAQGKLQDALTCYERLIGSSDHRTQFDLEQHQRGVIECLLALHQPLSALTNAYGMIAVSSEQTASIPPTASGGAGLLKTEATISTPQVATTSKNGQNEQSQMVITDWNAYRVEAAWKLGDWSALEDYLAEYHPPKSNADATNGRKRCYNAFGLSVGGLLSAAQRRDRALFLRKLDESRRLEMIPAMAACLQPEVYVQVYTSTVVRLHMLNDLQLGVEKLVGFEDTALDSKKLESNLQSVVKAWELRRVRMRPSGVLHESVLEVRRAVLTLAAYRAEQAGWESKTLQQEISSLWLRSAQLAREAGHYQHAYSCLLEAESRKSGSQLEGELCLEKATLSWAKGDHMAAIKTLDDFITKHANTERPEHDRAMARVRLLHATYSCEASCVDVEAQHQLYKRTARADSSWEDGYYRLAKSYDEIIITPKCDLTAIMTRIENILHFYCQSLQRGQAHMFHSLPRLLTIFFDLAEQVATKGKDQRLEQKLLQVTARLSQDLSVLRPCIFYGVMGQLVSRIVHPHRRVVDLVKELLCKVIVAYPERALWSFFFTTKYENKERQSRARAVIAAVEAKSDHLREQVATMATMTDLLLTLCRANLSAKTESLRRVCPALSNAFAKGVFAKVVLPTERLLAVAIDGGAPIDVFFHKVEDEILLLQSLQKPRRVSVRGSDGKKYSFLLKAEDDLRKDCRLMEFMGLINRFLAKEPDAYSRKLRIRTYHVSPLDDKCGIIEWVDNLMPLVAAVEEANATGGFTKLTSRYLAQKVRPDTDKLVKRADHDGMRAILEKTLSQYKPALSYWFRSRFPDAPSWYQAHTLFASSAAVMSMVGFILGLGDRHGENLLLETTSGQVVHVDFNLIFLRGRDLEYPEVVPFRLTQNMVDAMGPTGYEGTFRKCCQVTLKILRTQQDALMSVLSTMVHDPLVEWRNKRKQENLASGDQPGQRELTEIGYRLNGVFIDRGREPSLRPLSIEGQVALLINEATSLSKLGRMFPGWGPWL